jgi:4-amino-4-deoxy-L-arabinose transferase-like glycosyltransferase
MARSGDWITPRLWGDPWFEKPAFLYWMTGAAHVLGLTDETAARAPVAALSVLFLIFFWWTLQRRLGPRVAWIATLILSTTAGWLAYSFGALTDLPMTAFLSAALLIALFEERRELLVGILLGFAVLSKGLVPLVLFIPALWFVRRRWWMFASGVLVTAAPWYLACWARNGNVFLRDFFWVHHLERFFSGSLLHEQPIWYYAPVLLAGMFPWTPLLGLLRIPGSRELRFLGGWLIIVFAFFSISENKLPGYILPMLPGLAILCAAGLAAARRGSLWLAGCAALLTLTPSLGRILPDALLTGITDTHLRLALAGLHFLLVIPVVWWLERIERPVLAVAAIAVSTAIATTYLKSVTFPILDRQVSVRQFWRSIKDDGEAYCVDDRNLRRAWVYGLHYYADPPLPLCRQSAPLVPIRDGNLLNWK